MRNIIFQSNCYYHIYNRGVDKRKVFIDDNDYFRFLLSLRKFNNIKPIGGLLLKQNIPLRGPKDLLEVKPLVKIICYALLPNHYHLLLQQIKDGGISKFMGKISNSYTQYINQKNNRSGSLFQGPFKAIQIKSDAQLLYVSAYINGNAEIHKIAKAKQWKWSSCTDYLGLRNGNLCNKKNILNQFANMKEYGKYVNITIGESTKRKDEIKQYLLE